MWPNRLQFIVLKSEVPWCLSVQHQIQSLWSQVIWPLYRAVISVYLHWLRLNDANHGAKTVSNCFAVLLQIRSIPRSVTKMFSSHPSFPSSWRVWIKEVRLLPVCPTRCTIDSDRMRRKAVLAIHCQHNTAEHSRVARDNIRKWLQSSGDSHHFTIETLDDCSPKNENDHHCLERGSSWPEVPFMSGSRCVGHGFSMISDCSRYGKSIPSVFSESAADRKWPFGLVTSCVQRPKWLGFPRTYAIHRENTFATPGTIADNYSRFDAATVENGRNRLGKP